MLAWSNHHLICRRDIYRRWFLGIGMWNPYRDGESISIAAEVDGEGTREVK